ncbi:MAG TPA: LysM peptidoglycan-binding domain-containing protein [Candidatus Limnocylindrales bacterium]|nr:LysM peptidoglycan-binding domain-containing protein [Candidatus Limnocylindrales bacterium]
MRAVGTRARTRAAAAGSSVAVVVRPFTSAERALPIAVASIVAVAALLAFLPGTPQGAVSGIQGSGDAPRIAVNGGIDRSAAAGKVTEDQAPAAFFAPDDTSFVPVILPEEIVNTPTADEPVAAGRAPIETRADERAGVDSAADEPATVEVAPTPGVPATPEPESAVMDDGTLLTGYAPETTVEDGADLIRRYTVQKGDTLKSVAKAFGVSEMTLWWANKLKKDALKVGQELRIPPVSGLVYTVKDTDTLESVAKRTKVAAEKIIELNGLEDPTLVVGQVLVLPGAKGAPKPTPKPTQRPSSSVRIAGGGQVVGGGPARYSGGSFKWPVIGGDNYISQYFHYGHYGLDIAADYGARVVSAAGGKVIFAGWKSNGGGYQVWLSHGSGLYTTYNHMSAVTVSTGQNVGRGTQVGRIGASGYATGPHLHFEVWSGRVWDGGSRVNPLRYY